MNNKHRSLITAVLVSFPFWASAQTQPPPPPPSFMENLFATLFPIVLIGAFIWVFFVRHLRRMQNRIEAGRRHEEVMEKLLERIAMALEKKDKGPTG